MLTYKLARNVFSKFVNNKTKTLSKIQKKQRNFMSLLVAALNVNTQVVFDKL